MKNKTPMSFKNTLIIFHGMIFYTVKEKQIHHLFWQSQTLWFLIPKKIINSLKTNVAA